MMRHRKPHGRGPHAARAHWPAVLFAVIALAAMVVILVADAQRTGDGETSGGSSGASTEVEYLCEQGTPEGFELSDIEGKSLSAAEDFAESIDQTVRTVVVDGEQQVVTLDFRTDRINVQIDDGEVTRYCGNY